MIFYFSATGNCKRVATRLAEATNDQAISITDCIKAKQYDFVLDCNENIGVITPTYFFGLPSVVADFFHNMKISKNGNHYVYHVLTYYTYTGQAHHMLNELLKEQGLALGGKFIVRMPDTFTPVFDLSNKEKNAKVLARSEIEIDTVAKQVASKTQGDFNNRKVPLIANGWHKTMYRINRRTKKFTVHSSCTGCGLCEKQCPVAAITVKGNKAVWIKDECAICLGCLHRCPANAIQYGRNTQKHGQYVNPNVRL